MLNEIKRSEVIERWKEHMDKVSQQFRDMESYLHNNGVVISHKHHITDDESLMWAWDERSKKSRYRLMYVKEGMPLKPIMETPLEIRLLMVKHLPEFFAGLERAIENHMKTVE